MNVICQLSNDVNFINKPWPKKSGIKSPVFKFFFKLCLHCLAPWSNDLCHKGRNKHLGYHLGNYLCSNPDPVFPASPRGAGIQTGDLLVIGRALYHWAVSPPRHKAMTFQHSFKLLYNNIQAKCKLDIISTRLYLFQRFYSSISDHFNPILPTTLKKKKHYDIIMTNAFWRKKHQSFSFRTGCYSVLREALGYILS